eukprot:1148011-Pelagomonas_calceolata.AAC.7
MHERAAAAWCPGYLTGHTCFHSGNRGRELATLPAHLIVFAAKQQTIPNLPASGQLRLPPLQKRTLMGAPCKMVRATMQMQQISNDPHVMHVEGAWLWLQASTTKGGAAYVLNPVLVTLARAQTIVPTWGVDAEAPLVARRGAWLCPPNSCGETGTEAEISREELTGLIISCIEPCPLKEVEIRRPCTTSPALDCLEVANGSKNVAVTGAPQGQMPPSYVRWVKC